MYLCSNKNRSVAFFVRDFCLKLRIFILGVVCVENELYKKMYYQLFNAITDAVNEKNPVKRIEILKHAQIETEEMYISFDEN